MGYGEWCVAGKKVVRGTSMYCNCCATYNMILDAFFHWIFKRYHRVASEARGMTIKKRLPVIAFNSLLDAALSVCPMATFDNRIRRDVLYLIVCVLFITI
jgi:hypothetical protein